MNSIEEVRILDRSLEVIFVDGKCLRFEDCWLRDNCRCSACYHADTFQRSQHILDIPDTEVINVEHDKHQLTITWEDYHESTYSAEFLYQFDYNTWKEQRRLKPFLWRESSDVVHKVTRIHVDKFLNSVQGAKQVFQSLLDYGVAFIEGVEPNCAATEKVCQALGGVQNTIFGGMWEFTTRADHADTAYTNLPLAVHNDNTYFTEAAGLQILHCLEHSNGTGGNTLLVDGFYGAYRLKEEHPEDFKFLSTFDIEAEYLEKGHHYKYTAPVIRVHEATKDIFQIRFNVYDRSAMAFTNGEQCRSYYRSLRKLAAYYQDPNNQWQFKLKPGVVMALDNFRLLHGRTAFTGKRTLCGSYVSRSDWLDKARALRLIR